MDIKVNIPKNDYVQPKEVREKVVQDICNHIIHWMNNGCDKGFYELTVCDYYYKSACLYIIYDSESKTKTTGFWSHGEIDNECYPFYEKVRTCEMNAVFDAMQKAGYHIFGSHNITTNIHSYVFTTKPILNGYEANRIDFCVFID